VDAECQSARIEKLSVKLVRGHFGHPSCRFPAGDGAVALPDGSCLATRPARGKLDFDKLGDIPDPLAVVDRGMCPSLVRFTRAGGRIRRSEARLPQMSWLVHVETCCAPLDLAVDRRGRVKIEPRENPPEGCITGHRTLLVQEVYSFTAGRPVLRHFVREHTY
jgi:hypothetical protein